MPETPISAPALQDQEKFLNKIVLELSDAEPAKMIVNGVDLASNVTRDWNLKVTSDEALLTVTFPVRW